MLKDEQKREMEEFLENWKDNQNQNKQAFLRLKKHLEDKEQIAFEFKGRPKITYK